VGGADVNKAQLVDALAERLGDRRVAAAAVAGLVDVVVRTVSAGDKVTITGFGVFEKRERAARTARNPRTGDAVTVQQTDVPAFRPGTYFREMVSGTRELPRVDTATRAAAVPSVAPAASPPAMGSAASGASTSTSATSRPATRMSGGGRLTAVAVAPTKVAKGTKAVKVAQAVKADKGSASPVKVAKPAKAAKAAKTTPKGSGKVSLKGRAKKAGKKSATGK